MKEDAGWGGSASSSGKSFDSVRCECCFKGSPGIKYTYLACLKVLMWFVFAKYGLSILMVD